MTNDSIPMAPHFNYAFPCPNATTLDLIPLPQESKKVNTKQDLVIILE
jgi:hypothetical protein